MNGLNYYQRLHVSPLADEVVQGFASPLGDEAVWTSYPPLHALDHLLSGLERGVPRVRWRNVTQA